MASAGTLVFVFRKKLMVVPGTTVNTLNYACMLNEVVGIDEFSANGADFRSLRMFQKGCGPLGINDFHIIVQEKKNVSQTTPNGHIKVME